MQRPPGETDAQEGKGSNQGQSRAEGDQVRPAVRPDMQEALPPDNGIGLLKQVDGHEALLKVHGPVKRCFTHALYVAAVADVHSLVIFDVKRQGNRPDPSDHERDHAPGCGGTDFQSPQVE